MLQENLNTKVFDRPTINIKEGKIASSGKNINLEHLEFLDGLRAFAALYIVMGHAVLHSRPSSGSLEWMVTRVFSAGHYTVNLFIVLSGFCLMLPIIKNEGYLKNGSLNFFKRRAKRILPSYYLAMAFTLFLIYTLINEKTGTQWDVAIPVTNWGLITHLVMIQDIFSETCSKINYTFWSISVETRIYLFFPLIVLMFRKWGAFSATFTVVFLSTIVWYVLLPSGLNMNKYGICPHYFGLFAMGMLAAQISFSNQPHIIWLRKNLPWEAMLAVLTGLVMTTVVAYFIVKGFFPWVFEDLLVGVFSICLLVILSKSNTSNILYRIFSWKPIVFLGTFAYSIYLVHAPLIQIVCQYILIPLKFSPLASIIFFIFIGIPLIIAISYVFFLLAEKPFLSSKKKVERQVIVSPAP